MIRRRLIDHLDTVLGLALVAACFALYFTIGWWTLVLIPAYSAGAIAMATYAKIPWR